MKIFRNSRLIMLLVAAVLLAFCAPNADAAGKKPELKNVILATTTSTQDSGLLDVLIPIFEKRPVILLKLLPSVPARLWRWGKKVKLTSCWYIHRKRKWSL